MSCSLPEQQDDLLEELQYVELPQEKALKLLQEYKDEARRLLPPVPKHEKTRRLYRKRPHPHGPPSSHRSGMQTWSQPPRYVSANLAHFSLKAQLHLLDVKLILCHSHFSGACLIRIRGITTARTRTTHERTWSKRTRIMLLHYQWLHNTNTAEVLLYGTAHSLLKHNQCHILSFMKRHGHFRFLFKIF